MMSRLDRKWPLDCPVYDTGLAKASYFPKQETTIASGLTFEVGHVATTKFVISFDPSTVCHYRVGVLSFMLIIDVINCCWKFAIISACTTTITAVIVEG